jgi:DegV family protein with EDD domain
VEEAISVMQEMGEASESIYTLNELHYLIHGGRISHMKGLLASVLNVKPLIGVEKVGGTYVQLGQVRSFKKAVGGLVDLILKDHESGSRLHVQVLHSNNPEGAELLRDLVDEQFDCTWRPLGQMSLVFGAHTGPSMVGVAYVPQPIFE